MSAQCIIKCRDGSDDLNCYCTSTSLLCKDNERCTASGCVVPTEPEKQCDANTFCLFEAKLGDAVEIYLQSVDCIKECMPLCDADIHANCICQGPVGSYNAVICDENSTKGVN